MFDFLMWVILFSLAIILSILAILLISTLVTSIVYCFLPDRKGYKGRGVCDIEEEDHETTDFEESLRSLINRFNYEVGSNTPDFILASYMCRCLDAFDISTRARDRWYGDKKNA